MHEPNTPEEAAHAEGDLTGLVIDGTELTALIGRGATGEVWRARRCATGAQVALKVLNRRPAWNRHGLETFHSAVEALARLDHPRIVTVFEHGVIDAPTAAQAGPSVPEGSPYVVMEWVASRTLRARLDDSDEAAPSWLEIQRWTLAILDALAHAHARGVLHQNLKAENVLLGIDDAHTALVLTDFGVTWGVESAARAGAASLAPEQLTARWRDLSPATDLHAVGNMVWSWVCGRAPFEGAHPLDSLRNDAPALAPRGDDIPAGLGAWTARMMAREPSDRFRSAAEAAAAFAQLAPIDPATLAETPWTLRAVLETSEASRWAAPTRPARPRVSRRADAAAAWLGAFKPRLPVAATEALDARLGACLERVRATGSPGAVIVQGAPGVGASAAARRLTERAGELGLGRGLIARCTPQPRRASGLANMLREALGCEGLNRSEAYARICRIFSGSLLKPRPPQPSTAAQAHAPTLQDLAITPPGEPVRYALDAAALVEWIFPSDAAREPDAVPRVYFGQPTDRHAVLCRCLHTLARAAPGGALVLWIDDAHWSLDALRLVFHLLDRDLSGPPLPALIVLTVCADTLPDHDPRREWLSALQAAADVDTVVLETPEDDALPLTRVQRALWSLHTDHPAPDTLSALWRARFALAAAEAPAFDGAEIALALAACLGERVASDDWAAACALRGLAHPEALLQPLVTHGLAVRTPGGWRFAHTTARAALLDAARADGAAPELHRTCANVVAQNTPTHDRARLARLAFHAERSGDPERALDPVLILAEERRRRGDLIGAHQRLDQHARLLGACDAPDDDTRRLMGQLRRARVHTKEGRLADAIALLDRAEAVARAGEHGGLLAELLLARGIVDHHLRDPIRAEGDYLEALMHFEAADDLSGIARCRFRMGELLRARGALGQASVAYEDACRLFAVVGDRRGLSRSRFGMGRVQRQLGDHARADDLFETAQTSFEAVGDRYNVAYCLNALGESARQMGHEQQARGCYLRALVELETLGSHDHLSIRINLALLDLSQGRPTEALDTLTLLLERLDDTDRRRDRACALAASLACTAELTDWDAFDDHTSAMEALLDDGPLFGSDLAWTLERAGMLALDARPTSGMTLLEHALDQYARLGNGAKTAHIQATLARRFDMDLDVPF